MVDVVMAPANNEDAIDIAKRMRAADMAEVAASSGLDPIAAVLTSLDMSTEAWLLYFDGQPVCIWGVAPLQQDSFLGRRVGVAWLLTTPLVEKHPHAFWRTCRQVLPELLQRWDELINAIDVRHEKALRWAERLGFQLADPAPFGVEQRDFCTFRVRKEDLRV